MVIRPGLSANLLERQLARLARAAGLSISHRERSVVASAEERQLRSVERIP